MIIYLSSLTYYSKMNVSLDEKLDQLNGLLSFAITDDKSYSLIPKLKRFLLDSGAFTFIKKQMKGEVKNVNWDQYIGSYCDFIVEKDVKDFFEMDVDFLVGYEKVKQFRKQIIQKTGRLPIPVWHVNRGKKDFQDMCDEFPYVAVGGIVTKETGLAISLDMMKWLVDEAHSRGAIIHGLGFTQTKFLQKIHFDSVDSSSHLQSSLHHSWYEFRCDQIKYYEPEKFCGLTFEQFAQMNLDFWFQYAKYAESHL